MPCCALIDLDGVVRLRRAVTGLFVDDSATNAAAATRAGLRAHVFTDAQQLAGLFTPPLRTR